MWPKEENIKQTERYLSIPKSDVYDRNAEKAFDKI